MSNSTSNLSWDDLQNKYGVNIGMILEAQAQNQTPQQVLQQQQSNLLTGALLAPTGGGQGSGQSQTSGTQGRVDPGISGVALGNLAQSITQGNQPQQPSGPQPMGTGVDPTNYLNNLGTLGMRTAMGSSQIPVVGNPVPQSTNLTKGGIAQVPGPVYTMPTTQALQTATGMGIPGGSNWQQVAQAAGLGPNDITEFQKIPGMTPEKLAARFNVPAPTGQNTQPAPGIFAAATAAQPTQPWAVKPAVQPTGAQPQGQPLPFAQPPAAPTATTAGIGLAGPPSAPTPNMMGMMMGQGAPTSFSQLSTNHPAMTYQGGSPFGSFNPKIMQPPIKMASGGRVPGSTDTVPALLTPGEFVVNRQAVQNIGLDALIRANRGQPVQGFADGGYVNQGPELIGSYGSYYDPVQAMLMEENMPRRGSSSQGQQSSPRASAQGEPRQWQAAPAGQQGYSAAPQMTMQEHDALGTNMQQPAQQQQNPFQAAMQAARTGRGPTVGQYADQWNQGYQAGLTQQDPFAPGSTFDVTTPASGYAQTVGQYGAGMPQAGAGTTTDLGTAGGMGGIGNLLSSGISGIGKAIQGALQVPSWKPIQQAFGREKPPTYAIPQFEPEGD